MKKLLFIALLTITASSGRLAGQESAPSATVPEVEADAPESDSPRFDQLTLEEIIEKAYQAIERAEERGDDAQDALDLVQRLLPVIRVRDTLNADSDFLRGRVNLLLGRPREAIGAINAYASSRKGENDWLAFKLLGGLYFDAKYYQAARDKYRKAIELNPNEAESYAGMAQTELALARPYKAVEFAREAINRDNPINPSERNPQFYGVLATALLGDRKPEEASEAVVTAVELARQNARNDPSNPNHLVNLDTYLAMVEQISGVLLTNFPERTEEYARLVRAKKERAEIAHLLGLHRILQLVEQVLEQTTTDPPPDLVLEYAQLLLAVGKADDAAGALTDLLAKDPTNAEAKKLLARIKKQTSGPPSAS